MSHYDHTKSRVLQWLGIILIIGVFAGAYWYFQVRASTLNQSKNDLVTNGLVGLWSFNGDDMSGTTAYDRSGSGNNGTLTNGPTVTQGKIGQALSFDGTDDYVSVTNNASMNISTTATYAAWVNLSSLPSAQKYILRKWTTSAEDKNLKITSANKIGFYLHNTFGGSDIVSNQTLQAGTWYYVVGTYDGATAKVYINGSLDNSKSASGDVADSTGNLYIGATSEEVGTTYFPGAIDEVRIYNRALSATEIQSLYTQGGGTKSNSSISQPQGTGRLDSDLSVYWKFDEGSGTSVADAGTNGKTLTANGGMAWTTGQIGSAGSFDGTNDNATVTNSAPTYISVGDKITTALWYNANVANATAGSIYSVNSGGCSGVVLNDLGGVSTDTLSFYYRGSDCSGVDNAQVTGISKNTWHHVVSTYDTVTGAFVAYVDGVQKTSGTAIPTAAMSFTGCCGTPFTIGSGNGGQYFTGSVDEVRMYRHVLSADEVAQLYRLTSPTGVDTSLKGYWSFNGKDLSGTTASDRSGAGNNGTLTNGPTSAEGKVGQALNFDGTNDWVSVAGLASVFDTIHDQAGTVTAWFKSNSWGSRYETIFSIAANSNNRIDIRHQVSTGNTFQFLYKSGGGVSQVDVPIAQVSTGEWHFVVLSWSAAAGEVKAYLDGVQTGTTQGGPATKNWSFTDPASIGRDYYEEVAGGAGGLTYFAGKIDETRVYSRALSAGEIKGLYDAGGGSKTNSSVSQAQGTGRLDSGLAGYWKLDDASGTSATDSSTNGNTGTLTNGPTWTTGQVGGAVNFDGTDDYISAGQMYTTGPLTASVWVYTPTYYSAVNQVWLSNRTGGNQGFSLGKGSCTTVVVNVCDVIFTIQGVANYTATAVVPPLTSGQWDHVVVTYSGSELNFYVNGRSLGAQAAGSMTTGSTLYIGTQGPAVAGTYQVGKIDEARIYNRVLSADEVAQLYRLASPTGVDTSLKGYWSFNGKDLSGTTAYDRSGAGNNGTLTNGPTITEGKLGQALNFDGATGGQRVDAGSAASLDNLGPMTISTWIYPRSFGLNSAGTVASKASSWAGNNGGWVLQFITNKLYFDVDYATTDLVRVIPTGAIQMNTWQHLVVTWDGSTTATNAHIYINGVESTYDTTTDASGSRVSDAAQSLLFGNTAQTFTTWNGKIDEARIYNRALTAAEIAALYNSSR